MSRLDVYRRSVLRTAVRQLARHLDACQVSRAQAAGQLTLLSPCDTCRQLEERVLDATRAVETSPP